MAMEQEQSELKRLKRKAYWQQWYVKNKDRHLANGRQYHRENSPTICLRTRANRIKREFSITVAQYNDMLSRQGGVCAICGSEDPGNKKTFCIDHHHETGQIRGLLCHHCNTGIGHFKEDPSILIRTIEYLKHA